jgi:hypothetical protein
MPGRLTKITLDASTNVETIVELRQLKIMKKSRQIKKHTRLSRLPQRQNSSQVSL